MKASHPIGLGIPLIRAALRWEAASVDAAWESITGPKDLHNISVQFFVDWLHRIMFNWYTFNVACFAAIGSFLFGFDTGIITTTIAHRSWIEYMNYPSNALIGSVVSVYIAGEAVGGFMQTLLGDKLGRIRFMETMAVIVTIGAVLQTAASSFILFILGRAISGLAVGGMVATVPIYLSEIASPSSRGLIGGISGCGISFGTMASNLVGLACSYAPYGELQWRIALGLQIPWGVILFIGLATFMPNSPRQLIRKGNIDQARAEFARTHRNLALDDEFTLMLNQIQFESRREITSYLEIFRIYRRRAFTSIAVQTMTSLTGVNVIQYFATILLRSLGLNPHMVLVLVAVYGTVCFVSNCLTSWFITDQWGRRPMILLGLGGVALIEIYAAVMQKLFQDTANQVGKAFAILGIYLFAICYYGLLNSTTWLYGAEILPMPIRSKVMGLAASSHFIVNVAVTQAGPSAFTNIRENYYYVFVACSAFFFGIAYFWFPETRHKTLEEVAEAFGENVVDITEEDVLHARQTFDAAARVAPKIPGEESPEATVHSM